MHTVVEFRDGQGAGWTVGGNFYAGGGGSKPFDGGGGVNNFLDHFFPFHKMLANFFAIFIILSPQFEIFMGPSTVNHLKIL